LRKILIGAALLAALALPAAALAQNPAPVVTTDVSIPAKSGTASKPKAAKMAFKVVNSADSKTTVSGIKLSLPAGVKLDGNKLKTCKLSVLETQGPGSCAPGSKLGSGVAYAFLIGDAAAPNCVATNGAANGCLTFDTKFFVGARHQLNVFLQQRGGEVAKAFAGKISADGRTLTIAIPASLQQPAPGLHVALSQLSGSFSQSAKSGGKTHSFVSTTKCSGGKWAVKSTLTYAPNNAPAPAPASATTVVACK
jgi:hypothetical protein